MWDGLAMLVLLCTVMAGASFLVGSLPLTLSLSARHLRLITALGTGVLVGTALIVIIPEGVETLYSAEGSSHSHAERGLRPREHSASIQWAEASGTGHGRRDALALPVDIGAPSTARPTVPATVPLSADPSVDYQVGSGHSLQVGDAEDDLPYPDISHGDPHGTPSISDSEDPDMVDDHRNEHDATTPSRQRNPHGYVGISIVFGFVLMYLVHNLPQHFTQSAQPRSFQINLTSFSFNRAPTVANENAASTTITDANEETRASSTTVGLVIHAAADGVALGASTTSRKSLGIIIFIALMVHKAPAAFGLTSVLLKQGLGKRAARAHLIVFSLAAPAGALLTWFAVNTLGYGSLAGTADAEFITGVLLLFSGGTFLYVAMHAMHERSHDAADSNTNGYAEVPIGMYEAPQSKPIASDGLTDVFVTLVGMLLPLLTQLGHAH